MSRIDIQLEAIAGMGSDDLRAEWRRVFNTPPPVGFSLDMLRLALAYDLQARQSGRLPANVARHIERQARAEQKAAGQPAMMPTGTRLVREWHKVSHHVLVTDAGYLYRDRNFASLSAIAREITGVIWSGPRFFGLKTKRGATVHA